MKHTQRMLGLLAALAMPLHGQVKVDIKDKPFITGSAIDKDNDWFVIGDQSAIDASGAGLKRMKFTEAVNVSGLFAAASHTHAASDITSGTVATARLGSGTASSSTFLRGDQTWATISAVNNAAVNAAIAENPAASRTAMGAVSKPLVTKVAIVGDSIGANARDSIKRCLDGYASWIEALSEGRLRLCKNSANGNCTYATSGYRSDQILATHVPQLLADYTSDTVVVVYQGINDVIQGVSAGTASTNMIAVIDALIAGGVKPEMIITSPLYSLAGAEETAPRTTLRNTINTTYLAAMQSRGVRIFDWRNFLHLSTNLVNTAYLKDSDLVHPSFKGARWIGGKLFTYIAENFTFQNHPLTPEVRASAINANATFTGGTTLATDWSAGAISPNTNTNSLVARTDNLGGQWQQIVTTGALGQPSKYVALYSNATRTTTAGAYYRLVVEVEFDSWDSTHMEIQLTNSTAGTNAAFGTGQTFPFTSSAALSPGRMVLMTDPVLCTGTSTALNIWIGIYGNCTARFGFAGIVPATMIP